MLCKKLCDDFLLQREFLLSRGIFANHIKSWSDDDDLLRRGKENMIEKTAFFAVISAHKKLPSFYELMENSPSLSEAFVNDV